MTREVIIPPNEVTPEELARRLLRTVDDEKVGKSEPKPSKPPEPPAKADAP